MKRLLLIGLFLGMTFATVTAQKSDRIVAANSLHKEDSDKAKRPNEKKINIGFKMGFNSSMYFVSEFKLPAAIINSSQNNYKTGYSLSAFARYNIGDHFIQQEANYIISNGEILFNKYTPGDPQHPGSATVSTRIVSLEFPVLYGYNFIKNGPYGMSFFVGPNLQYIWGKHNKIEFENFSVNNIKESLYPFNVTALLGVAVNISHVFFDFRYEFGLHNISKGITYEDKDGNNAHARIYRRHNVLSFSLGFIL